VLHIDVHGRQRTARVVLVHGFTQTGRVWGAVAAELARSHQVVAVDAPGHGYSEHISADLWQGARLLGEAGGQAAYIGYSMGGRLCLHLALTAPYLVRKLVLVGATAGIDHDTERTARRAADEVLACELERDGLDPFLDRWLAQPLFAGLAGDRAERAARRQNTVEGLASSLRLAGTGTQEPLWARLHRLSMPVLVVAGASDAKFTALGRRLAEAIGANARLEVIPEAGHAVHLEQPARFLTAVAPFLVADHDSTIPSASNPP
jgi:2-succinyl-6-hydroxy-2,4-cyclohexadiene-1-carboxylate synthase